jgi:hypothetical protein
MFGNDNSSLAIAHGPDSTLAVRASGPVGCDIENGGGKALAAGQLRHHVALEVCRKLGRKPSSASLSNLALGAVASIEDVNLILIELPLPSGSQMVAFGRLQRALHPKIGTDSTASDETVL